MTLSARANRIRAVALDIDGVLTDGRIGYGPDSDEMKFFDVKDGLGIKLLQRAGIKVGVVSGRSSKANRTRIAELGLDFAVEGSRDKAEALCEVATQLGGGTDEILFVGDDLVDLPAFSLAGVTVAVGDAVAEVKQVADLTTGRPGGRGAIREAAEWLLREQGKWADLVQRYTGKGGTPAGQA
jgi:3-deoxy-D-manno-octulosonate 8-phosphate phosphatase (KDO 8-P phosphatase)